jgi:hypothetical protein
MVNINVNASKKARSGTPPRRPSIPIAPKSRPMAAQLNTCHFAMQAIEKLMDSGGFISDTKAQFALRMGWTIPNGGKDEPDRRRVENICNLTRDQHEWPEIADMLGGYVIAYAPNQGGMSLIDPTGDMPLDHLTHILLGDLQKQQGIKTINRRRLPTWKTAGESAAAQGDNEMARLFWQAEGEINKAGFVSDSVIGDIFKAARVRDLLGAA